MSGSVPAGEMAGPSATGGPGLARRAWSALMLDMAQQHGSAQPEPTGWAFARMVRESIHQLRHPAPLPVRYLHCDGCGNVTPHTRDRLLYTIRLPQRELTAPPPEAVCDECGHAQPRTVDDEIPADTTVTCIGHRHSTFGYGRSRRRCEQSFEVPAAASSVLCPWCVTVQPGPDAPPPPRPANP
jgi:hypothetical protein